MKNNNHKEILITCRRTAQSCMKHLRQKAIQVILINFVFTYYTYEQSILESKKYERKCMACKTFN